MFSPYDILIQKKDKEIELFQDFEGYEELKK